MLLEELYKVADDGSEKKPVLTDKRMQSQFSDAQVKQLAEEVGIDTDDAELLAEFKKGLAVEREHAEVLDGHEVKLAKVVKDHLDEMRNYYTELKKMENKTASDGKEHTHAAHLLTHKKTGRPHVIVNKNRSDMENDFRTSHPDYEYTGWYSASKHANLAKEAARFVVSPAGTTVDVKTLPADSPTRVYQHSLENRPSRKDVTEVISENVRKSHPGAVGSTAKKPWSKRKKVGVGAAVAVPTTVGLYALKKRRDKKKAEHQQKAASLAKEAASAEVTAVGKSLQKKFNTPRTATYLKRRGI